MREPGPPSARQTGEMTTCTHRPDADRPEAHDTHDRLLIAARAAGDLGGRDLERADTILSTCDVCQTLLAELRSIAEATHHLPPVARPADVDFRLTPARAAGLARGGLRRRLLRPFGSAGSAPIRPLAMAFTTLGLAGLLLAALPLLPYAGGGASLPTTGGAIETPSIQAGTLDRKAVPPGGAAVPVQPGAEGTASAGPASPDAQATDDELLSFSAADRLRAFDEPPGSGGPTPLVLLSVAFLGLGIGLALLRRAALRLR